MLILFRWKSLFAAGFQIRAGWIDDVTDCESEILKSYCMTLPSTPTGKQALTIRISPSLKIDFREP